MAIIRSKDAVKLSEKDILDKIKDLKMELVKNKVSASKGGKLKIREIRRTIARLHTIHRLKEHQKIDAQARSLADQESLKDSRHSKNDSKKSIAK